MGIDCWDRFDRKTLLAFTEYKDRYPLMMKELDRVGMRDVNVQWQFPSPFNDMLLETVRHEPWMNAGYMSNAMGHYMAISTAYYLGCKNVLIMEDDIRFLKDIRQVGEFVEALPEDFDVAKLDYIFKDYGGGGVTPERLDAWISERKANGYWSEFDSLYSTGCYALSRKAMERMMFCFEAVQTAKRVGKLRVIDHFHDRNIIGLDLKMYIPRRHMCIQRKFGDSVTAYKEIEKRYNAMKVVWSDYEECT